MSIDNLSQYKRTSNCKSEKKSLYTFMSAKKIYLAQTPSKYFLIEKKDGSSEIKSLSLSSRNTIIMNNENGIMIFPKSR